MFGFSIIFGSREERRRACEYESSAQLVTIMGRGVKTFQTPMENYSFRHQRYDNDQDSKKIIPTPVLQYFGLSLDIAK
jgi:hypothetical protein